MNAIGIPCLFCRETIIVQSEASGCLRCGGTFHRECAVGADHECPSCQQRVDYAERAYRYSAKCPDCLSPNTPPQSRCAKCGAWTRWNDEADYQNFRMAHRKRCQNVIRTSLVKAALVLAGGALLGVFTLGFWLIGVVIITLTVMKAWSLVMTMLQASRKLKFE